MAKASKVTATDQHILFRALYGERSLASAEGICHHMIESKMAQDHPAFYGLMVSIHVLYGRPFTTTWNLGKFGDEIVPSNLRELHNVVLTFRNKVLAHTDSDGPVLGGNPANEVRYKVQMLSDRIQSRLLMVETNTRPTHLPSLLTLCGAVRKTLEEMVKRLHEKHLGEVPNTPGEYLLSLESNPKSWVKKAANLRTRA